MNELIFEVAKAPESRLDKWISENDSGISRSLSQRLIAEGLVTVNGAEVTKSSKLKIGDSVRVTLPAPEPLDVLPENIPIDIIYEDGELLVINKPKGMVVHPAPGHSKGTLVNALLYHCSDRLSSINGIIRPGIVHRIDKDTSGLLAAAKTNQAHLSLAEQIKNRTLKREYYAVVHGRLKENAGIIDAPIGRSAADRKKMCVTDKNSREARTEYTVLAEYGKYSLLRFNLITGRTHQIRVHMSYIGHPVLGDEVYGSIKKFSTLSGQCLHSKRISFTHPVSGENMEFDSELPEYFIKVIEEIS